MKAYYQIKTEETGMLLLHKRKIAKAYRWWLRENGYTFEHTFFVKDAAR